MQKIVASMAGQISLPQSLKAVAPTITTQSAPHPQPEDQVQIGAQVASGGDHPVRAPEITAPAVAEVVSPEAPKGPNAPVVTLTATESVPPEVERAATILNNAPLYRDQVGAQYVTDLVPQVPEEFRGWLRELQPLLVDKGGQTAATGRDPYHLLGLQMKSLSLAMLMAETQAQIADAQGQSPDRQQLLRQELQHQFDATAYCQLASPELLNEISSRQPPPDAQWSGKWFCEQLRQALGRPPQTEASPLQKVVECHPDLLSQSAQALPGSAATWTQVMSTTSGYLAHMNDVMGAENQAAQTLLKYQNGQPLI